MASGNMAPIDRSELLRALAELARRYPDWRFGQLVSNVAGWTDVDVWEVEDEELLAAARGHLEVVADRQKPDEVVAP
jgi:hypothetical protein